MSIAEKVSGFLRTYTDPNAGHDVLMQMAESSLRRQFNRCAPHILDAEVETTTLSVNVHSITHHFPIFYVNPFVSSPVRTPEEQLQDVASRKAFKDLQEYAETRGLEIAYRIEAAPNSAHPARIFADVTLVPYRTPDAARCASFRQRAPHWPLRRDEFFPPEWTRGKAGPGAAAPV